MANAAAPLERSGPRGTPMVPRLFAEGSAKERGHRAPNSEGMPEEPLQASQTKYWYSFEHRCVKWNVLASGWRL
jgi:hypothetical protein